MTAICIEQKKAAVLLEVLTVLAIHSTKVRL